jgi:uncharacterized protein YfaS (alpha-2-macroglobulin family)
VAIVFSDPLDPEQALEGLVTIQSATDLRLVVEQNHLKVYPSTRLTGQLDVTVFEGIRNSLKQKLYPTYIQKLSFDPPKPEVRILGKGTILPGTHQMQLPFEAISLKAVEVKIIKIYEKNILQFFQVNNFSNEGEPSELKRVGKVVMQKVVPLVSDNPDDYSKWKRYAIDLSEVFKAEPGAIYQVSISFKKEHSAYSCGGTLDLSTPLSSLPESDELESENEGYGYDFYDDYYPEDYDYRQRENPCHNSYYAYSRTTSKRLVFSSDLGIIAKKGKNGEVLVVVTNLLSTDPISGAQVELYDYQHQIITEASTDNDGLAKLAAPENPYFLIVKDKEQRGYLRVDNPSALPLNYFDVSGAAVEKGLKGFLYGERSIWRPGDSLFVSFILENKQNELPADLPVVFELYNPQGTTINRQVSSKGVNGLYTFITSTPYDAPTGKWNITAKVGGVTFSLPVRIETIVPNRLKLQVAFDKERFLSSDKSIDGKLKVQWLTGLTASNLKTEIELGLAPMETSFKDWKDYSFDDLSKKPSSEKQVVFDDAIDQEGNTDFSAESPAGQNLFSGFVKANFRIKVSEKGGGASTDRFSVPVSPYSHYVGIKMPVTDKINRALKTDEGHKIEIATINENGIPANREVEVKVYKLEWRWWWDNTESSVYMDESYMRPIQQTTVRTNGGKGTFAFRINYPDWGRYFIIAKDRQSGHSASSIAYVDWPGYGGSTSDRNGAGASVIALSTDKEEYKVGEEIALQIPPALKGRALVSIETGSKVLETHWAESEATGSVFRFKATAEMSPGIFANVTLIHPHGQTVNDLPIRMYGVVPIKVSNPEAVLQPVILTADEWRPEADVQVTVKEQTGKKMTYTLAVVDEGLLDLTKFATPNPYAYFYAKEALGVNTWDMYDYVLGAFGGKIDRVLSLGGDGELKGSEGAKANRFKPVVKFLGPFTLDKGDQAVHTFKMPNYVGSVRVMVVAGQNGAYGNAEKAVPVRKPLMVLASLPRVLGPNEEVDLPINVFTMAANIKNVNLTLAASENISIVGTTSQSLQFNKPSEQVATFCLKVKDGTGIGKLKIFAVSGKEKAGVTIEIDIRNPNLPQTQVVEKVLKGGESWVAQPTFFGMNGTNSVSLEVSNIPPLNLGQRLHYLLQYPYGCVEQTVSAVFPQLYLPSLVQSNELSTGQIEINVKAAIRKLAAFQVSDGSFAYWPGGGSGDEWATTYAGHFLLEAKKKGYDVPGSMINNWKKFQSRIARQWQPNNYYYTDLTQAYRLMTLALAGNPELGAMNRLRESSKLGNSARWRLALAYALAGQEASAKSLVNQLPGKLADNSPWFASLVIDKAVAAETFALLKDDAKSGILTKELSTILSSPAYLNTQEIAYSLQSIARIYTNPEKNVPLDFTYSLGKTNGQKVNSGQHIVQLSDPKPTGEKATAQVKNNSAGIQFVRLLISGIPKAGLEQAVSNNLRLKVNYIDANGNSVDVQRLEQGTNFIAEATISHTGLPIVYTNLALRQVFPSGWEIKSALVESQDEEPEPAINEEEEVTDEEGNAIASVVQKTKVTKPTTSPYDYRDTRDDRVFTFFNLRPGETKTYRVSLTAAYIGKFYLPSQVAESMYNGNIQAVQTGFWVEVVPVGGAGSVRSD